MTIAASVYTTEKIGPNRELTPEGFLLCKDVPVARTGTMLYGPNEITGTTPGPDGIVKAHRSDEDVFCPTVLASALGKPITNDHPDGDVNPSNWKEEAHGMALNVRRGDGLMDDLLLMDLLFTTEEGIEAVQDGKREISLGYNANYEEIAEGEYRQFNIVINHIALVEEGRCGPRCAIKDKKPTEVITVTKDKKLNKTGLAKIIDLIIRASSTKDSEEIKNIVDEVINDNELALGNQEGGKEGDESARTSFTDDDIQAHVDQNAKEHEEMKARISALEEMLKGKPASDNDNTVTDEEKMLADEAPEGKEDEAKAAKDSALFGDSFMNAVANAEILVPGIRIQTYDAKAAPMQTVKKICGMRRQALDLAYGQPETRGIIDDILSGKKLDTSNMTCDAVRTLFNTAASVKKASNNISKTKLDMPPAAKSITLDDIERMNKEYYK